MLRYTLVVTFESEESAEDIQQQISDGDLCPEDIMSLGEIESETVEEC